MNTKIEQHWFNVELLNCKLPANSHRPHRQIHKISATSTEEARKLAREVFSYLFGSDTYIGDVTLWV